MLFDEFVDYCEDHYGDRHGIYAAAVSAAYALHTLIEEDYDISPFFELILSEVAWHSRNDTLNFVKRGWIDVDGESKPPISKEEIPF